jgi:hypothetical protein
MGKGTCLDTQRVVNEDRRKKLKDLQEICLLVLIPWEYLTALKCNSISRAFKVRYCKKSGSSTGRRWLTPVIPATQEAEIRRIAIQSPPRQTVRETLSRKNPPQKKVGEMPQGVSSEFKPQ